MAADKIDELRLKRELLEANKQVKGFVESKGWDKIVKPAFELELAKAQQVMQRVDAPAEAVKVAQVVQITTLQILNSMRTFEEEIERLTKEIEKLEEALK